MKACLLHLLVCLAVALPLAAQDSFRAHLDSTELSLEVSATASTGTYAPLWLTANRHGLSSVRPVSGYQRVAIGRSALRDSARSWQLGYALDIAVAENHERTLLVQQAYVEAAWKVLRLTLGAKEQPLVTQNDHLSSGALATGINARPIPQARLDIEWFGIPGTRRWWRWRLYGSFGFITDGNWQQRWTLPGQRYDKGTLYHEKALYWRIGREDVLPLTYDIGIRMATQFGGTTYNGQGRGVAAGTTLPHPTGLRAFWNALTCQGSDETDGSNPNTAGNHLGSYVMQLRYTGPRWQARAYWERYFEDQSMLTVQYGIRDMLIGGEVTLPRNRIVSAAVLEFLTTTDQSGAVYHDRTAHLPDKMNGRDNYYNHNLYSGWQHFGMTPGHPLLTSPLYNGAFGQDHTMRFYNNRIKAWHVGLSGDPTDEWHWRLMATLSRNWGCYDTPLTDVLRQTYLMAEATYRPVWAKGWSGRLGMALDHGALIGNSFGAQLTIRKSFILSHPSH